MSKFVLAFDTANETVAVGVGEIAKMPEGLQINPLISQESAAHRASNTLLITQLDTALELAGVAKADIAAVVCGRGPGSFTGVRICMATAKGVASALEVPLYGVSTLDAVAWNAWQNGVRGHICVVADAMRKEVYPAEFSVTDAGVQRLDVDTVIKATELTFEADIVMGDGLAKYSDIMQQFAPLADEALWQPTGIGLLLAAQALINTGAMDISVRAWHGEISAPGIVRMGDPAVLLPVYTRLSDAEENERIRLAEHMGAHVGSNLQTGVQDVIANDNAVRTADIVYRPLDARYVDDVACLEALTMGTDAWNADLVLDELPRKDRTWWAAYYHDELIGYCGGWVVDGDVQILKIATDPAYRRLGIAHRLLAAVACDARDLGATTCSLEVRSSNAGAHAFYEARGLQKIGVRPGYYSDGEDATIYQGPLPVSISDVAGMELMVNQEDEQQVTELEKPLILAIESSCDETAASVVDGNGALLSDVVASQIDFHSRFGGVVPEIASRKHIEAICGVTEECLEAAARSLNVSRVRWRDLDAVAVTYAPGLVGALVVGVAFAKGAAWGADKPLIAVNHLEGHLYANKIASPDIKPPMVVSLVSGGHTMLVHVKDWGNYETLGSTIDDAVGEAFDKVAKALGLGYPGGPLISKLAAQGNPRAINFPRAMMHSHDLRFSLSGLKTAVTFYIQKEKEANRPLNMPDIAASFQQAVIDVQVAKAKTALIETGAREFCLGGGVAANPGLRAAYDKMCASLGVRITMPPLTACGDNAAMIALVASDRYAQGKFADWTLDIKAHAPLDEPY